MEDFLQAKVSSWRVLQLVCTLSDAVDYAEWHAATPLICAHKSTLHCHSSHGTPPMAPQSDFSVCLTVSSPSATQASSAEILSARLQSTSSPQDVPTAFMATASHIEGWHAASHELLSPIAEHLAGRRAAPTGSKAWSCHHPLQTWQAHKPSHHLPAGHGGPGAAAYVQENLWKTLHSNQNFDSDLKQALGERADGGLVCCVGVSSTAVGGQTGN